MASPVSVEMDREPNTDGMTTDGFDAFISYNQAADAKLAKRIRRGLERIGQPFYRRRTTEVFLDDTSLSASARLWGSVAETIDNSRYFVLLASERAAKSRWVDREIRHFRLRPSAAEDFLIVLTDGELIWDDDAGDFDLDRSSSCPEACIGLFTEEPLFVDLRWLDQPGIGRSVRRHRLRSDLAKIVAPVRGLGPEDLVSEDIKQLRRNLSLVSFAAVGLAVLAVVAVLFQIQATRSAQAARSETVAAIASAEAENQLDRGLLLGVASGAIADTSGARRGLFSALATAGSVEYFVHDQSASVRAIATSGDNETIVTASTDGALIVRDRALAPLGAPIVVPGGDIREVLLPRDGRTAIVASDDGSVSMVDLEAGVVVETVGVDDEELWALAFDPTEQLIYVGRWDGIITVLNRSDLSLVREIETSFSRIRTLASTPSGLLAIGGRSNSDTLGRVAVFDPETLQLVADTDRFPRWAETLTTVPSLAISPIDDGTMLFGSFDGGVSVWRYESGDAPRIIGRHDGQVNRVRIARSGELAVTAGFDHSILVWNASTWEPIEGPRTHHGGQVWDVAIDEADRAIISGSEDGTLVRFGAEAASPIGRVLRSGGPAPIALRTGSQPELLAVGAGSAVELIDTELINTGLIDTKIINTETLGVVGSLDLPSVEGGDEPTVLSLDYRAGFDHLIVGYSDRSVIVWDLGSRSQVASFETNLAIPATVTMHPSEPVLLVGGPLESDNEAGVVEFISTATGLAIRPPLEGLDGLTLLELRFSPDGSRLLLTGQEADRAVVSWPSLEVWEELAVTNKGAAVGGSFGGGAQLAIGTDRQQVALVGAGDSGDQPTVVELSGHSDVVFDTAFSPDGQLMASGGGDRSIIIWELGSRLAALGPPLIAHTDDVLDLEFSSDGTRLFSRGRQELVVWDLDQVTWESAACAIAGRSMTDTEWRAAVDQDQRPATC